MTPIQSISPNPNLRSPFIPFRIPNPQTRTCYRRRSQLRVRSSTDGLFKTLISTNPIEIIPAALTLASGAALYLSRNRVLGPSPKPVIADWILFTSPTPFNRCVLLRCPSISFEDGDESEKLLREERHYVNLSRGRILGRNEEEDEEEEEEIGYQRVCVRTEDGGVISLDWPENLDLGKEYGLDRTVLIVPGTAEGSMDRDVRRLVINVLRSGCFPVIMNPRGCAGSPLTTARLFTVADSDDVCTAIKHVTRSRPWATLMGVGLGYGANMLTKYVAEVGESTPLTAAVCIDNPFDLEEATRSLPHHIAMDQKLTGGLMEILRANKELFQGKAKGFDLAKALSATTVRDFDEAVSMVSYGFDNIEDFYSVTSTRKLVTKLKVPVLFIQSDDGTVPLFSVPRSAIAENPFTSLLLCSCHQSVISRSDRSTTLWCQQLTIEWLAAVELALLKGRHPLLKDVDITINPSKGLSFVNGKTSDKNFAVQNKAHAIYDSPKWFLRHMNPNNSGLKLTSANTVNGFLVNKFTDESDGVALAKKNIPSKSESGFGRKQKDNTGIREDRNADASQHSVTNSSVTNEEDGDAEGSQVLQTATVVMNMLDVTMPGTLDDDRKKKVLTAMEQGQTLMKALEGAVPDDVCGKLTSAVTEIMQTRSTNLSFDGLKKIGWIQNVTSGKPSIQERPKGTSTAESGQDGTSASEQGGNGIGNDGGSKESIESISKSTETSQAKASQASPNVDAGAESIPKSTETSQAKASQASANVDAGAESIPESTETSQAKDSQVSANVDAEAEVGGKSSQSDKSEETSDGIDDNVGEQNKVNQRSGKGDKRNKQVMDNGNDIQSGETRKVDSPAVQDISASSTHSEETSSAGSFDSEHQEIEKVSDVQKNVNKTMQDAVDQNIQSSTKPEEQIPQSSTKPEEQMPQSSSPEPPPISVTQALDALTGFDDSTQMAVNSVYGVLEEMIDQFEKASNQENGEEIKNDENHEIVNSKMADERNNKSGVEPDVAKPSDHPESIIKEEDVKSYQELQDNLKKVGYSLISSGNNCFSHVKESNMAFKNLENKNLSKVDNVNNFPIDVAGNQYWSSPYASYLHRYYSSQVQAMKSLDLESATDLFLDPEEGRWRMMDGYPKNTSEGGENERINGRDHISHENDTDNTIEPSYVILDNEFYQSEHEAVGEHDEGKEEFACLIKNKLLDTLKIEAGRRLGKPDLTELDSNLVEDLEQFAVAVSQAVVHDSGLKLDSFSESGDTESKKFGTIEATHVIETISSLVLGASYLRKVLPLGVIVGSSLAVLRTYFQVVSLLADDQSEAFNRSRDVQENSYAQQSNTKKGSSGDEKERQLDSNNTINEGHEELQTNRGVMAGAVTAAIGASALLAHHEIHKNEESMGVLFNEKGSPQKGDDKLEDASLEKNQNNLVSSLAEKAMSVAGPVVPTKSDGEVDQDRLVATLAELVQKGGILRSVGKAALLWGGIRGAMSLTDRLITFLHIAQRPLSHRVLGFASMVLVLWSPVVIPLLPTLVQSWTTNTSNLIVDYACIVGLYVAMTILVVLWGKRIRGYENPLQQYGLELTSTSRVCDFFKGLVGGITIVLCIHSINALLGYASLSWPGLPSSSLGALALIKAYGSMMLLAVRGAMTAIGISVVEELLFRSWLVEEIAVDLGYYRANLLSGLAFSLSQRSLPSLPGFLLLSVALSGMKQRTEGNLSAPIGMRAGIMTTNFILQTGGFLVYWPNTPFWLASTHPWHPFDGIVGVGSCLLLAILLYPKTPQSKEISKDVHK